MFALRQILGLQRTVLPQLGLRAFASRGIATEPASVQEPTVTFQVGQYKGHKVDPPSNTVTTTRTELLNFFESMFRMRLMELAAHKKYQGKLIRGFCHLYDGQEAIVTGMEAALKKTDSVITSYRDHCVHIGRGGTPKEVFAELFGRTEGCSKGIGGSMHMYKREANYYGGCGIVGAQIPLGAGLGFAHKYREDGGVSVAMYGDGAANQGQKYEALNMAALWNLPVIFVCENNHFGMGTAILRAAFETNFYKRGDYVAGITCDGQNVLAVKQAFSYARNYVLDKGPIVLELDTYRYHGHSMSDPGYTYRTKEEVNKIRKERDPITKVRNMIVDQNLATEIELKKIEIRVKKELDESLEEAEAAPFPPNEWLFRNIYKNPPTAPVRGVDAHSLHKTIYDPNYEA
eukprot:g4626.t1